MLGQSKARSHGKTRGKAGASVPGVIWGSRADSKQAAPPHASTGTRKGWSAGAKAAAPPELTASVELAGFETIVLD